MHNTPVPDSSSRGAIAFARWWHRLTSNTRAAGTPPAETSPMTAVHVAVAAAGGPVEACPAVIDPAHGAIERRGPAATEASGRPRRAATRGDDGTAAILERLRVAALITDAQGLVTFANGAAARLLGVRALEEASGRSWDRLLRVAAEDLAELHARLRLPGVGAMLPACLERVPGRSLRVQVDIQPHPSDARRRLWLLYDPCDMPDLTDAATTGSGCEGLIGEAPVMKLLKKQIQDVAPADVPVLLEGETGTGKELVARAIHRASARGDRSFVAVNCAGLTESLLNSQLFGHRRGAFTGAIVDQTGLFEEANGGTLFLDEIGDMPLSMQTSLLRALQEREIVRLGESRPRAIDVRVIAATHHHLETDVAQGRFRRDLFYRIRVSHILLPPLRHRREDIPLLAATFLRQFEAASRRPAVEIGRQAMDALCAHDWPGNVRELRSVIESAALKASDALIRPIDLFAGHAPYAYEIAASQAQAQVQAGAQARFGRSDDVQAILQALKQTRGNRAMAARLLGVSRSTFYRRLAALGTRDDAIS